MLTRTERLERLPMTREHGRLLGASGVGWALDAMDVGLISFVIVALGQQWGLDDATKSWVVSAGFIGMALGATFGGLLADKIGRRSVFALTLLVYGLATGATAVVSSVAALLLLRFVVGLGLGAELPVASTLISEFAPRRIRGRVVIWLEAFWAVGWILSAIIGYFVVAGSEQGWRWALALGAVPALWALLIRLGTPESVRYLETAGRYEQAEATVGRFERSAKTSYDGPTIDTAEQAAKHRGETIETTGLTLFSKQLRRRTLAFWLVWFCINLSYYGAFIWIPSLLVKQGFTLVKSFEFTLVITLAQLPGYAVAAWLIEVIGRRLTLALFLAGSALSALGFAVAGTEGTIIAAGCALSFFNLGAWGALYAIGPELYPTSLRGTGTGAAAGVGRLASIIAPLLVPVLMGGGGIVTTFAVFAVSFALAAGAAFLLPEKRDAGID